MYTGFVYLHENGKLQWKPNLKPDLEELADSDMVQDWWMIKDIAHSPAAYLDWLISLKSYKNVKLEYLKEAARKQKMGEFIPEWEQLLEGDDV